MYTVLFPSGKTLVFSVRECAETWIRAYQGILIGAPVIPTVEKGYLQDIR